MKSLCSFEYTFAGIGRFCGLRSPAPRLWSFSSVFIGLSTNISTAPQFADWHDPADAFATCFAFVGWLYRNTAAAIASMTDGMLNVSYAAVGRLGCPGMNIVTSLLGKLFKKRLNLLELLLQVVVSSQ